MSSFSKYVGNGAQTVFAVTQPMPSYSALEVSLDGLVETTGFTYNRTNATVTFAVAPADGVVVKLSRVTKVEPTHKFATGAAFTARNVDTNFTQESYRVEELQDNVAGVKELEESVLQAAEDAQAVLDTLTIDYVQVGTFAAGYDSLQHVKQTLRYSDGHDYGWTGAFPKKVEAGDSPTPLGAGGWVDRSDVNLRGELADDNGANLISTGKFFYYLGDAPDDGTTDATDAFSVAAAQAATYGVPLIVAPPAVSYLLNSNPTIPTNTQIQCNLSWFSGVGKLPAHSFVSLSEGVDQRVFDSELVRYVETEPNEELRKWAVVGWVNYKNAPRYADTRTDAVGVDGRGVTSVANGRVWGLLGLAQMDDGVSGVAQALGCEVDVNQNHIDNDGFDGVLPAKGVVIVSGGIKRPESGLMLQATHTPTGDGGDNRFFAAMRVYRNAYKDFGLHFDDDCGAIAIRAPHTAVALRATAGNTWNFDFRMDPTTLRGQLWCPIDKAIDVLYADGSQLWSFDNVRHISYRPVAFKNKVTTSSSAIDANGGNIITITSNTTITSIANGYDGQEITLINASGSTLVVNQGSNMRMVGGTFSMSPNSTITFVCSAPTWFEKCRVSI